MRKNNENQAGIDLANTISKAINTFGHDDVIKACVEALSRDHRTLQQTFTMLCCAWFRKLAADPDNCDPRNEASVNLAVKVVKAFNTDMVLPFI